MRALAAGIVALACGGCWGATTRAPYRVTVAAGNVERGRIDVEWYGCPACHTIPGIRAPGGQVGPPLGGLALRSFLAGELVNTPENLVRWLADPHRIQPRTAMPTLGLTEEDARDVAAFLYTLD